MNQPVLIIKSKDNSHIEISGKVTGEPSLRKVSLNTPEIHIDLNGLTLINSPGVKDWIDWTQTIQARVVIHNAPKFFVDHVNIIKTFLPKGTVIQSFYIPHVSDTETGEEEEKQVLYERGKDFAPKTIPQEKRVVDSKGYLMPWDVIPSKFFRFIPDYT